jgi:foldase protein PrsA
MRRLVALFIPLLVLGACGEALAPAAAVVNGDKITTSQVSSALHRFEKTDQFSQLAQQQDPNSVRRQFEQGYLGQQIRRRVIAGEANRLDVTVSDAAVQDQIDQIKQRLGSEQAFQNALAAQGLTMDQLETAIRDQLLEQQVKQKVTAEAAPSEATLRSYYRSHTSDYTRTRAQHILVKDKNLAARLSTKLQAAPRAKVDSLFAKLAKQYSTDKSNSNKGGDLGYTTPGQFVPEFDTAMAKLKVGEVSDPVKTQFGYHVIRVTDRKVASFSEVRNDVEQSVAGSKEDQIFQRWLIAAYQRADVKVNSRYGELDIKTQQIVNASAEQVPGVKTPGSEASPSP